MDDQLLQVDPETGHVEYVVPPLSRAELYALEAMKAMLGSSAVGGTVESVCEKAWAAADAMLENHEKFLRRHAVTISKGST